MNMLRRLGNFFYLMDAAILIVVFNIGLDFPIFFVKSALGKKIAFFQFFTDLPFKRGVGKNNCFITPQVGIADNCQHISDWVG